MGSTSFAPKASPHLTGWAVTDLAASHDAALDELIFDVSARALRACGAHKHEVGLSVTASLDVYDGRSISSGLTNSAAGGYLADSYRIEGDAGSAIAAACDAVSSGDVDIALAVAVFNPETTTTDGARGRAFLGQLSNLAFDPHFDRPVGLFDDIVLAMHAGHALLSDGETRDSLAATAARLISRGAAGARAFRTAEVSAADVLDAPVVSTPLTELMLPAVCAAAGAVIVMSPARAARARGSALRLIGIGHGAGSTTSTGAWLSDPAAAVRRAAAHSYRRAGLNEGTSLAIAEFSAPTPALVHPVARALQLDITSLGDGLLPSGGVASAFPGIVNGLLRLVELAERLSDRPAGTRGVAHSSTALTGTALGGDVVIVGEVA